MCIVGSYTIEVPLHIRRGTIVLSLYCTSVLRGNAKERFNFVCSVAPVVPLDRCWKGRMAHAYGTVVMMDGGKVVVVTRRA